jgi:hypothetical protein
MMQSNGEGQHQDLKLTFDLTNPKAKVELVKDLVAMANGGGGRIVFGCSETTQPGIDEAVVRKLDSAKVSDLVATFIRPATLKFAHEITSLGNGRCLYTLTVTAPEYPIVMAKKGDWSGMNNRVDRSLFNEGDVWFRENTGVKRITFEYLRSWIDRIRQREREGVLELLNKIINVPDGAEIQIVTPSDGPIDTPNRVVEYATKRRGNNPNHLLSADDLLSLFINRHLLNLDESKFSLLIASALRRKSTLFWWLGQNIDNKAELVMQEVRACLDSKDRDKSDAGKNIIEMVATFASDEEADEIVRNLENSDYKHFRVAASTWVDCNTERQRICDRINAAQKVKQGTRSLGELSLADLESLASSLAVQLIEKSSSPISRKLGDVTRLIWSQSDTGVEIIAACTSA